LDRTTADVERAAIADVLIHVYLGSDPAWLTPQVLAMMVARGFTSTKTFTREPYFDTNAVAFVKAFRASGAAGGLCMVHWQDASILADLGGVMVAEGRGGLENYAARRPAITEEPA